MSSAITSPLFPFTVFVIFDYTLIFSLLWNFLWSKINDSHYTPEFSEYFKNYNIFRQILVIIEQFSGFGIKSFPRINNIIIIFSFSWDVLINYETPLLSPLQIFPSLQS